LSPIDVPDGEFVARSLIQFLLAQVHESLTSGADAGIFDVTFNITNEAEAKEFQTLRGEDVHDWAADTRSRD